MTTAKQQAEGEQDFMDVWDAEVPGDTKELARRARLDAMRDQRAAGQKLLRDEYTNAYNQANEEDTP